MIRTRGKLQPATYQEALQAAVAGLTEVAAKHGPDALLFSAGGRLPIEECEAFIGLGKRAFGGRAGSLSVAGAEGDAVAFASNVKGTDLLNAETVVVLGEDPLEYTPVAAARLRRAMRNGAKVVALTSAPTQVTRLADLWVKVRRGSEATLLGWLQRRLAADITLLADEIAACDDATLTAKCGVEPEQAVKLLSTLSGEGPLVAMYVPGRDVSTGVAEQLTNTAQVLRPDFEGSGTLVCRTQANVEGLLESGLVGVDSASELVARANAGAFRGAWLLDEDTKAVAAAVRNASFLVVQATANKGLARRADVLLPATSHLEAGGTFLSWDGRRVTTTPVLPAKVNQTNLQTIEAATKLVD
jgi:assimilatory nitrate reductase catalytic subunit